MKGQVWLAGKKPEGSFSNKVWVFFKGQCGCDLFQSSSLAGLRNALKYYCSKHLGKTLKLIKIYQCMTSTMQPPQHVSSCDERGFSISYIFALEFRNSFSLGISTKHSVNTLTV